MDDPSEIRISVALVTCNRPESLERCLKSWRSQTISPWEIVVSDDSDATRAPQIEAIAQQYHCTYTRGPQRGLYANRNHASLSCRGTHILSGDDDHIHPPDYVETVLEVVQSDSQRIWVFTERNFVEPNAPLVCPGELGPKGGDKHLKIRKTAPRSPMVPPFTPAKCLTPACATTTPIPLATFGIFGDGCWLKMAGEFRFLRKRLSGTTVLEPNESAIANGCTEN